MKYLLIIIVLLNMSLFANRNYKIYDTKDEKVINLSEMSDILSEYDVVFFGEFHDDSLVHNIQKEYLDIIYEYNYNITVSLEMFERDVQKDLDKYLKGEINEEEFLKNSRPWKDYEKFYKPLVSLALENGAPVLAANIPRKYASMFAKGGMTAISKLSDEEKEYIAKEMILKDDEYKTNFFTTMLGSKEKIDSLSPNEENTLWLYYGAQLIKDETMAESILNHYKEYPENQIIHFNGDFHSKSYLGTVDKLLSRNPDIKVAVISPYYSENAEIPDENFEDIADIMIFLDEPIKKPMKMPSMGMHLGQNYVHNHNIDVKIIPGNSEIVAKDSLIFKNPVIKSAGLKILNSLNIKDITADSKEFRWEEKKLNEKYKEIIIYNESFNNQKYGKSAIKEIKSIVITYEGKVYNKPSETNLVERHSRSAGIISNEENEGFYLPGMSYYPATDKDMANFKANITVPEDFTLITSGKVNLVKKDGNNHYYAETEFPIDNLILVGARYEKTTKTVDGIDLNVYTYEKSNFAETYANALVDIYNKYTALFGDYPFESFSIVENFFSTGFGMPGYTLLGGRLMAMPWVTLSPGSLPHEFVHNWWGNSVFVDYEKGNWCEALTTFSANYYYNKLNDKPDGLVNWRKKALIAIDALPEEKNYPLAEFEYQRDKFDAVIGYEKGAFLFYELYKLLGEDNFFNLLKQFAADKRGERVTWFSIIMYFSKYVRENKIDVNIRKVFMQWLYEKEIPTLKIANVDRDDNKVSFNINSNMDIYSKIPVLFEGDEESKIEYFTINKTDNKFEYDAGFRVEKVLIDPDYQVLRELYQWEKPYSFNRTLGDNPIVILPEKDSEEYELSKKFVRLLKQSGYDFDSKSIDDVDNSSIKHNSLILLGNINNNKIIKRVVRKLPDNIEIEDDEIEFDDENELDPSEHIMLINSDHPKNKNKLCTVIYYDDLQDLNSLARFFHYQSYSMVTLKIGQRGRPLYDMEIYPSGYDKDELIWKR